MFIFGVESTAHTFGVGIVNSEGKVLANITDSYTSPDAGMIPDKVAEHHKQVAAKVMQEAFSKANLNWDDIAASDRYILSQEEHHHVQVIHDVQKKIFSFAADEDTATPAGVA